MRFPCPCSASFPVPPRTRVADHAPLASQPRRRLYLVRTPSGGRTLSGTFAEALDSAAIAARVRISGSLTRSEAADSASASAQALLSAAGVISEILDTAAGSAAVKLAASAAFAEGADGDSGIAHDGVAGALNGGEGNDACSGHAGSLAPAAIDLRYLHSARPRLRCATAPARSRSIGAFPRTRRIAASQQRA
jgi:hypothetical protein